MFALMQLFRAIIQAARLRTLPLAFSSIITGNAIAYYFGAFNLSIFILSLLTTLLLQVLSNFSNDLGDSEKGTDNAMRIGPKRTIQAGLILTEQMKFILKITIVLALLLGIILLLIANILLWEKLILLLLGLLAIWAANNYTRGKTAYGYRAMGDVFVFIFFGIVGVVGSLYLSIHSINNAAFLPAIGVGLLSVAVLHLNNMRDLINDKASGKITLAIKLGYENSKIYFLLLIITAIGCWFSYVFTQNNTNYFSYLYWIGFLPLVFILIRFFKVKENIDYDALLKPTALCTFFIAVLFFISQII